MKMLCILVLFLSGCVNINIYHYNKHDYTVSVNEEKAQNEEEKNEAMEEKTEEKIETPPVIIQQIPRPLQPSEPEKEEPEETQLTFLDVVKQFKMIASAYELNYFTPISIYEIYGVNELCVEEFVGGNRFFDQEIVEAAVLKAKDGQADIVYQKVAQRHAFLLAQYPDSTIVHQAAIIRNGNWIIYSVLTDNQSLIDGINELIQQM